MIIGLLKEPANETRVSLLADGVATLTKKGLTVHVESDAGLQSFQTNQDYEKAAEFRDKAGRALRPNRREQTGTGFQKH